MPTFKIVQSKKGFTLLELIVVIAILGVVTIALSSLLMYGNKTTAIGNNQFAVQSDARLAMDEIVQELRFAKELTIIDAGVAETEKSTTTYNYIYIKNGRIYKSLYDSSSATRSDTILSETVLDSTSQFVKVAGTTDTLKIQIGAKKGDQEFAIDSTLKLVNLSLMKPVVGIQGSGTTLGVRFKVTELPTAYVYTFTFKTGGGSTVPSVTQASGTTITPPANPTRTGYTFAGWLPSIPATMPIGGGSSTAQWTVDPSMAVITFSNEDGQVDDIIKTVGDSIIPPISPARMGNTFIGWTPELPTVMPLGGANLTAVWMVNAYTITFDSDGGSLVSPITQDYGTVVTAPTNPIKPNFSFVGWNPVVPSTMPENGATLTALWTPLYTISFNSTGGSPVSSITLPFGASIMPPLDPTKTGYTFLNWNPALPSSMPEGDETLTAQWTAKTFTVTFDKNHTNATTPNPISQIVTYDQQYGTLASVTRSGKTFDGWWTDKNNGIEVTASTIVKLNGDQTLFAHWQ